MKTANLSTTIDLSKLGTLNKFLFQDNFQSRLEEIKKIKITLTAVPKIQGVDITATDNSKGVLRPLEKLANFELDPKLGNENAKQMVISGYDESKLEFLTLEGVASFVSHAIVCYANDDILPITYLSFNFYSRSEQLFANSKYFKATKDPKMEENKNYAIDRSALLEEYSIDDSLLLIDGPLIGGNLSSFTVKLVKKLESKNVTPIFIVKNSDSNLVTDNVGVLKNKYHSDLHWAYTTLKPGHRTSLFLYEDQHNKENTKVFFYIKPFDRISPQRIEFHLSTYAKHTEVLPSLYDVIYYLFLLHGDYKNPQIRPVAVAEKYAREVLGLINPYAFMKSTGITPTINQTRFGE